MSCVLRISGTAEAVRRFVERGFITPDAVFEESINIGVSDAGFDDLEGQIREVIAFLERNGEQLLEMCEAFGFDDWCLDFGLGLGDSYVHSITFPTELLFLAGQCKMDIEVSLYPISDPEPDQDEEEAAPEPTP